MGTSLMHIYGAGVIEFFHTPDFSLDHSNFL